MVWRPAAADDNPVEFTKAEVASIRRLATTLPWTWVVSHKIGRGPGPAHSYVAVEPRSQAPSWLPLFSLRHTQAGWWADEVVDDEGEVCGPFPTIDLAFAAIPQRIAAYLVAWGLQHVTRDHTVAA